MKPPVTNFVAIACSILLGKGVLAATNVIIISGSPVLYEETDTDHDKSWSNYVRTPRIMHNAKKIDTGNSEVWWFVHKPGYTSRWNDDVNAKDFRKEHVKKIRDRQLDSYTAQIEEWAKDSKWQLRWVESSDDLWKKLETFKEPVEQLYYFGHAQGALWLGAKHDGSAVNAEPTATLSTKDIESHLDLKPVFANGKNKSSEFWGCNTAEFAKAWHKHMGCPSAGFPCTITFRTIEEANEPEPIGCSKTKFP